MRIVALNINGGGSRTPAIVDWIASRRADIVILAEWRATNRGEELRNALEREGFTARCSVRSGRVCNGLMIAARRTFDVERVTPADADKGELLLASLPAGLSILAAYFPQRQAKAQFFEASMACAKNHVDAPFLLIGDLNTGRNELDIEGRGSPFDCEELFVALEKQAGLRDLWRDEHRNHRESTWLSHAKNGFRVDHAFGNQELIYRLAPIRCHYDHQTRKDSITDHSALIVELSDKKGA